MSVKNLYRSVRVMSSLLRHSVILILTPPPLTVRGREKTRGSRRTGWRADREEEEETGEEQRD